MNAAGSLNEGKVKIVKVAARSRPPAVAGAIAGIVRESGSAKVRAIGAWAVYQAVRAAAIAREYLTLDGFDVICIPSFVVLEIDGREITAIELSIEPR